MFAQMDINVCCSVSYFWDARIMCELRKTMQTKMFEVVTQIQFTFKINYDMLTLHACVLMSTTNHRNS